MADRNAVGASIHADAGSVGQAVDVNWSILNQVMRAQVITIDPTVNQEWAGDWEVMETTPYPFAVDAPEQYGGSWDR